MMPENFTKDPEPKVKKSTALAKIESALKQFLFCLKALSEVRNYAPPQVIDSPESLAEYEAHLAGKDSNGAKEKLDVAKQNLIDSIPYADIPFKVSADGKLYLVKRENKTPADVFVSEWVDSPTQ